MFSKERSDYAPVAQNDEESLRGKEQPPSQQTSDPWKFRFYLLLSIFAIVTLPLAAYTFHAVTTRSQTSSIPQLEPFYSPAYEHAKYVYKDTTKPSPEFMGKPRPEMDKAWHDLLEGTLVKFSAEELQRANATSLEHKDGGYVGGLGLSHNLHCLKRLRQILNPDYYYSTDHDWEYLYEHVDHCLESLRQTLMCQADLSIYTLRWTPHSSTKPGVHVPNPNVCVDWDGLHGWMKGRAASLEDVITLPEEIYEELPTSKGEEKDGGNMAVN
ncbi:unnamed protein product [Periconia digitata]|uniref:Tat pathway signal sequence n=1 Tax=Periconia digitata TaxID=1303443 RepID=A0A9W4XV20_9PLEO|nr:unnamed protein product [Periconia digitata]